MHIAILGCGQLSRMLALAGMPMGIKFSFIADIEEDTRCVEGFGVVARWQPGDSISDLYQTLGEPDLLTVEKEQVDVSLLQALQSHCPVHPNPEAFSVCQHRYHEKQLLDKLGIPCADYIYGQPTDIDTANISLPVVVKSCREGYDGKNQWVLKSRQDLDAFNPETKEKNYIIERRIPFDREISQVSVRGTNGAVSHYPLAENHHVQGMLRHSVAPATDASKQFIPVAQDYMQRIMEALDYVGVMAMECFVVKDQLLVNELAPRVHNSGHWTQSGSRTCQFTNHMRAIAGMSIGSTNSHDITGMLNLVGTNRPSLESLPPNAALHWYNKVVRLGRKLGHINFSDTSHERLLAQIQAFDQTNSL